MAAGTLDLTIEQGATFDRTLTWRDAEGVLVPLTNLTARMHIRTKVTDATELLELTTENDRITLTDPGVIDLHIDADDTALLTFKTAVYDLEIVDPSTVPETVTRLVKGTVTLSPEVTR
jgi:hypothetical protein